jgi:dTDP-4-amino-4,6-dideoxygalactose transaminase
MVYYPVPVHRLPVYGHLRIELPEADKAAAEALSLPIWPQIEAGTQQRVAAALRDALRKR